MQTKSKPGEDLSRIDEWIHNYRAEWSFKRLTKFLHAGDRVLSLGAGDCRLDALLEQRLRCEVTSIDIDDYNETTRALTLYDGEKIPFEDQTFDSVLLIFALHHAEDPKAVLTEATRVCKNKGHIIVFEDAIENLPDRLVFRGFHRFLRWSQGFPLPNFEWTPAKWSAVAAEVGLKEHWSGGIGRTLGYLASRHIAFVWERDSP